MPDYEFTQYRRKQIAELRPYIEGEDVSHVSISPEDVKAGSPKRGDMIARNPKNHDDQWLVARAYFLDNFEPLTAAEQAEPLGNDVEIHRWQRATAVQSRKLQMVLDIPGVKERLQEVTGSSDGYMLAGIEQAEPAPAARSGAVKSEAAREALRELATVQMNLSIEDWCRISNTILAALEPAEPATAAEPSTDSYSSLQTVTAAEPVAYVTVRKKFYVSEWGTSKLLEARNGGLVTDEGEAWIYGYTGKDETGGSYDMLFRRVYTHPSPSEARLREALADLVGVITEAFPSLENTPPVLKARAALKEASDG